MEIRKVKIEEYWPLIVRGTEEFGQIAVAENPEFNRLAESVYGCLKESFILPGEEEHATEYGVSRWEKMLGLAVTPDMTLDDRKAAILRYLSIKLPYTWRVLKRMLTDLLGEDNFTLSFDNETQVLSVAFAAEVTQSQIDSAKQLHERVIPQNIDVQYATLPIGYTSVEYLESTGTQYIDSGVMATGTTEFEATAQLIADNSAVLGQNNVIYKAGYFCLASHGNIYLRRGAIEIGFGSTDLNKKTRFYIKQEVFGVGEVERTATISEYTGIASLFVFARRADYNLPERKDGSRIWTLKIIDNVPVADFIPALDPTGTPCLYDTVTRTPFYNAGTGDFIYPTDSAPVMTLDLDEKFYAKLTEHGVRRLYKVPEGCTLSKDEYAAKHGFKELLEPPMPQTGYWTNVWKETDTQLICEWVETEPPMEVTEND